MSWGRRTGAGELTRIRESSSLRVTPSKSLAFKLALLAVAPFALLSTVLLLGVTYQFERLSEMTIGKQEMEFSTPVVQEIEAGVRNAHESLGKAATRIATLPVFDEPSLRQALEREDHLLLLFSEGLVVTNPEDQVLASVGPVRLKCAQRADCSFPAPSAKYVVSLPFEALSMRGHPAVAQTVPILVDGQVRGYLSGASDLFGPRYLGPYRNTRFGKLGYFSLTTPNRILFLHKDPKRILHYGGPPGLNLAIDRGLQGWEGWMNTTTSAGPMITAIRQIPSTGWILSVHYPKSVAQAPFLTARRDLVLAVALGAGLLLAFVLLLSRRMVRPLSVMTRQVEALTEGTSDVPIVPVHSADEIGVLSKAFNRLVEERSAAEEELRASEERFRLAFRTSPEPISMTRSGDNVLVAVNEAFERLFGVSEVDALGHTIEELGIRIDPTDDAAPSLIADGMLREAAKRAITPNERRIELSVSSNVVNLRGKPHLLTISRDVTALRTAEAERERLTLELRTSEERHRRVVRNVPVVQWALDKDGVFTLAEGLGLLSLGQRSEHMVGSNLFERYADNARILGYFRRARDGQLVSGPFEQGAAAFDSHWGPLRDESERIVGVTAIALDVTERKSAELARRETEARMGVLERLAATGRLAAGVAHEINNPLTYVISNLTEILAQVAATQSMTPLLRSAEEAMDGVSRVAAIVRDLRVFSGRPQQGQPRCQPMHVVSSAVGLMRNQIRHRARLEVEGQPTPDAAIEDGRLTQVLVNLLMNACQAITEGDVEAQFVRVRVRHEAPWIVVEVADSGEGIEPETLPHLFEPFFTTRRVGEGSGLGLSVSFAIVNEVGGTIEVHSSRGMGAKFLVKLPVAEPEDAISPPEPERTPTARRLRLLVIDDEPRVARSVARCLGEHDVTVESHAQAALQRLRAGQKFDVILTDLMMPGMSGMQFHSQLLSELPQTASNVLFMSGGAFGPEAHAFVARFKPTVYAKPIDLPLLAEHLRRLAATLP